MTTVSTPAIVRTANEGDRRWFYGGGVHIWKAKSDETDGAFLLFEDRTEAGKSTPLHTHPSDETFYLLEGEILLHLAGVEHRITTGGMAVAPRGVPHAFCVVSDLARLLCLHTPGSCQAFYFDASDPLGADEEPSGVVDFARVRASAERNGGIEILGPPPFSTPGEED